MKHMLRLRPLLMGVFLSLSLVLATVAGAVANFQMATGQMVAICSDAGVAQVQLDAKGNPVTPLHGCPDCLPGLHASVLPQSVSLPIPLQRVVPVKRATHHAVGIAQVAVAPFARGPPVLV